MTERKKAHLEDREPFLEKILSRRRFQKVIRHIPRESRVLDLGCGFRGSFLREIFPKISSGVGLDISVSNNSDNEKIIIQVHDLNEPLLFSNDEFDIVTSLANLEHLENPARVLREIQRVLKPGGRLLLTTPSTCAKPVLEFLSLIGLVSRQEIKDHKNYFNKKILTDLAKKAGFSSARHKYFQLGMNNFLIATK